MNICKGLDDHKYELNDELNKGICQLKCMMHEWFHEDHVVICGVELVKWVNSPEVLR